MEILQQMLPQQEAEVENDKNVKKAKSGFKRVLFLVIILMIFNIVYTILQRLSDGNFNAVFHQMMNKMSSIGNFRNITKIDFFAIKQKQTNEQKHYPYFLF